MKTLVKKCRSVVNVVRITLEPFLSYDIKKSLMELQKEPEQIREPFKREKLHKCEYLYTESREI